jgi:serine/threonine-protein kinase RsbT
MATTMTEAPPVDWQPVITRVDAERARRAARQRAQGLGFGRDESEVAALIASELATNLVRYAQGGRIGLRAIAQSGRAGLEIASRDDGPGIADLRLALNDGYSTGGGWGHGLPAVRRLANEFDLVSTDRGTIIVVRLWAKASR